jgi:hypothetical protein
MPHVPAAHRGRRHVGHRGSSGLAERSSVRVRVAHLAANLSLQPGKLVGGELETHDPRATVIHRQKPSSECLYNNAPPTALLRIVRVGIDLMLRIVAQPIRRRGEQGYDLLMVSLCSRDNGPKLRSLKVGK